MVTVALFTNLRAGCVYFKIYGNYLTTPWSHARREKNAVCIFRVNAEIVTVKTRYSSTNTPPDIKKERLPGANGKSFRGEPFFAINVPRIFQVWAVESCGNCAIGRELSNNGQTGFPLLYNKEPEPWPPAIHCVYGPAAGRKGAGSQRGRRERDKDVAAYLSF